MQLIHLIMVNEQWTSFCKPLNSANIKHRRLTKSMTMGTHRRHHGPLLLLWIKTLNGIQSLESISASDNKQKTIDNTNAEL